MYFNRYTPAAKDCKPARARRVYNAVCNFCGKAEPRFPDFVAYRANRDLTFRERAVFAFDPEAEIAWAESLRAEWAEIHELVRNAGQPLRDTYVVYFGIIDTGVKCGETRDLVQRYSDINHETPIGKMWYMEVNSKKEAKVAEHALHRIFDHARCMNRQMNKKDYYECDVDCAQKFITAHSKEIYEAIMKAIEGI